MYQKMLNVGQGGAGASSAEQISYDNTISGLNSENVQDAVDEINSNLAYKKGDVISNEIVGYGYTTGSSQPRLFIPLSKPISSDVTSVSVSGKIGIKINGNQYTDVNVSTYTPSIYENGIRIVKDEALVGSNVANHTLMFWSQDGITIRFL